MFTISDSNKDLEKIRKFIQDLIIQKAYYKQLLSDMAESLTEEQIDELLD